VIARFNGFVTSRLRDGAVDCLLKHGADADHVDEIWVPGAFEIPLAARAAAGTGRYDAVICLGAVIRGETPHFDFVAGESARGIGRVSAETGVPAVFGVLTTDSADQALARAGGTAGNKGWDAALAAMEMAALLQRIRGN
jgi:6,7-dimethyl-8-ribityllumazine synthase